MSCGNVPLLFALHYWINSYYYYYYYYYYNYYYFAFAKLKVSHLQHTLQLIK